MSNSVILATAGYDHKICFWEAPSGRCHRIIKFADSQVNRLEISPDKQFIAAAGNPVIRLYEILEEPAHAADSATQQAVLTLEGHTANVTSIGFQRDGRYLYSGSEDGTIKVWDLRNPNYSRSFDSGSGVNSVTLRVDRDEFISGDQNGNVKIWDLGGRGCLNSVKPFAGNAHRTAESPPLHEPPGTSSSGPSGSRRMRPQAYYSEGAAPIQAVDISEDSRTLVAVSNHGTVFVWDPTLRGTNDVLRDDHAAEETVESLLRPVAKFRAHTPGTYCLHAKIAPDCRHLVTTGSDGSAHLWDTTTWELTSTLQNQKWVWDAAFCADSSYLVTASSDHVARLWNLRTADVVKQYHGHQSAVTCVALNDSNVM